MGYLLFVWLVVGQDFTGHAVVAADDGIAELCKIVAGSLEDGGLIFRAALCKAVGLCVAAAEVLNRGCGNLVFFELFMDNLTLFGRNKRKLRKLRGMIEDWLAGRRLKLNNKWQLYPTAKRTVAALGYRFGHKFSLLRKRNMVRLKKSLSECYRAMRKHQKIRPKLAQGLLSRLGQMKHCNHVHFFEKYVETGLQRKLKLVVREHTRKEQARWNMCTEPLKSTA